MKALILALIIFGALGLVGILAFRGKPHSITYAILSMVALLALAGLLVQYGLIGAFQGVEPLYAPFVQ